jgi:hypothetical protein
MVFLHGYYFCRSGGGAILLFLSPAKFLAPAYESVKEGAI